MLGKLMKYEWRGYRFAILIMCAILLGFTILTCGVILTIDPRYDEVLYGHTLWGLIMSILLYYFGIIGCSIGISVIIAVRFYKTCYTDQGYLTHTLPVSPNQLLIAKFVTALLTYLIILLLIIVTIFIIISTGINHFINLSPNSDILRRELAYNWAMYGEDFKEAFYDILGIRPGSYMILLLIYSLISCAANIMTILGCISLGQLYTSHRILGSIIAYFAVQFVLSILSYLWALPMYSKILWASTYNEELTFFNTYSPTMLRTLLSSVVVAIVMYFINLHMMTKKLNLE